MTPITAPEPTDHIDTAALLALAKASVGGNWKRSNDGEGSNILDEQGRFVAQTSGLGWRQNAAFIAAANPETVTRLCEEVERLRAVSASQPYETERELAYELDAAQIAALAPAMPYIAPTAGGDGKPGISARPSVSAEQVERARRRALATLREASPLNSRSRATPRRTRAGGASAWSGEYNPACCRFPKSCSCTGYDPERVTDADLERGEGE